MRFHPFGAAKLTTSADRLREPALNWGQLVRTLLLFIAFALALALVSRESRAAESGSAGDGEVMRPFST